MVAPFMVQLRQWVLKQKADVQNTPAYAGHRHPPASYDENLTDDNMVHETLPSASSSTHPENIDSATRELQRLLQIKPPTQGLQLPSPISNQQAGQQALLSILQPKVANTGFTQGQGQLHAPRNQDTTNASRSSTLHHHQDQRMPEYHSSAPSSRPVDSNTNHSYSYQQQYIHHRPRPHVFITNEIPQQKPEKPPVQLLHPQPLPPQVQKEMLLRDLRDLASTPNVTAAANQSAPPGVPRGFHPMPPNTQHQQPPHRSSDGHAKHPPPPQLAPHSANLLNVLKGNNSRVSALQQSTSHSSPLAGNVPIQTEVQHLEQRLLASGTGFSGDYGGATLPSTTNPTTTMNAPAPFARGSNRPVAPTDQHRVSLLGLFKTGQSTVPQSQVDGQAASFPAATPRSSQADSPKQQPAKQGPSTADVLKAAARENGQPIQWNPELNLPYGAHSILRRGPSRGSARSPAQSTRNSNEIATQLPLRSHPSPASSRSQMSPRVPMSPRAQMSPYRGYRNARIQSPRQAVAQAQLHTASSSYPYGGNHDGAPNPLAQFQSASSTSTLPVPGAIKPRQNSTVEQRKTLLSIFGKPEPEMDEGRGNDDTLGSKHMATSPGPMPRSRLASFASQGSRRGSATPLSPADRNFLLGFLENASNNAKS